MTNIKSREIDINPALAYLPIYRDVDEQLSDLLDWLNVDRHLMSTEHQQVLDLLALGNQLRTVVPMRAARTAGDLKEYVAIAGPMHYILNRFRFAPMFMPSFGGSGVVWICNGRRDAEDVGGSEIGRMILIVLNLLSRKKLTRLQQCITCNKWLNRPKSETPYCSRNCRQDLPGKPSRNESARVGMAKLRKKLKDEKDAIAEGRVFKPNRLGAGKPGKRKLKTSKKLE